jgi:hypothetical protein
MTLVEMAIVCLILVAVGALVYQVAQALTISYKTGETKIQVEENLRAAMATMVREVRQASKLSLVADFAGFVNLPPLNELKFRVPQDMDGNGNVLHDGSGGVEYSVDIKYYKDEEGRLIREQDMDFDMMIEDAVPGERRVIANHLEKAEFELLNIPDVENLKVQITLTVQRPLEQGKVTRTLTEVVIPRN